MNKKIEEVIEFVIEKLVSREAHEKEMEIPACVCRYTNRDDDTVN